MKTIQMITHYEEDDPYCNGDYLSVDVLVDGEIVMEYSDYYHDKGKTKAREFIKGVMYTAPTEYERLPDEDVSDGKVVC